MIRNIQRHRNQHERHPRDEQVQHDLKPALDAEHRVERLLGGVQAAVVVAQEGAGPAEGADRGEAGEGFGELRVQGGLHFEVEESDLAGGAEVVFLDEVEGEEADGDGGGDVGCSRGDEACFCEGAEGYCVS